MSVRIALLLLHAVPASGRPHTDSCLLQKPNPSASKALLRSAGDLDGAVIADSFEPGLQSDTNLAQETELGAAEQTTCADLKNHGTHFTVEIEVGTPGQKFDVVADTGSDALIVASCACVRAGYCSKENRCFQGTSKSTTFAINEGPLGPPVVSMMFGSGPVQAVVATDTVRVGKLNTNMPDGILLMTDQMLNINGQFEGILGLGLPSSDAQKGFYSRALPGDSLDHGSSDPLQGAGDATEEYIGGMPSQQDEHADDSGRHASPVVWPAIPEQGSDADDDMKHLEEIIKRTLERKLAPSSFAGASSPFAGANHLQHGKKLREPDASTTTSTGIAVKGFMEEAGIERFSMCFNDGSSGALRLGTPKAKARHSHGSVGQVHWGLDFRGISVGDHWAPVEFCTKKNMTKGQKTPCGAIPDSGTTAIMAPQDQLITLYESLCDRWDRCKKNHTAMVEAADKAKAAAVNAFGMDPWHIASSSKAVIFQSMILDCRQWMSKRNGLDELPKIHFHVRGVNGTKQTLSLAGWSYIIETQEKEFEYTYKTIPGMGKLPIGKNYTGSSKKVCSPAFSPMEYNTKNNGPVWILGSPLFYEYRVGYDLSAKPPAMSFSSEKCGSCGEQKVSFISKGVSAGNGQHERQPRQVDGPFRMPDIDFTKPL